MRADPAGTDDDDVAGQPGALLYDHVAAGGRDGHLALGAELRPVVRAGEDRDVVSEERVLADLDGARGEVDQRVVEDGRWVNVQPVRVAVDQRPEQRRVLGRTCSR